MIWLKSYTDKIRAHLAEGDEASLTYAALETRLGLERVCYERLKISHEYISADDLRRWTPAYVVQTVMELVDPKIASEWTLKMSKDPVQEGVPLADDAEFVTLGTQKGFDPTYVKTLWNAMGNFLHCSLPKSSDADIQRYSSSQKMKSKIEEALKELDRLTESTIAGAMVFNQISFKCVCGQNNSRSETGLRDCAIINCIKEGCKEQYVVEKRDDGFWFERYLIPVKCKNCNELHKFPFRALDELPKNRESWIVCEKCKEKIVFAWRLMQRSEPKSSLPPDLPAI